jgi:hypothetical protein
MIRLRGRRIAGLVGALSVSLVGAIVFSVERSRVDSSPKSAPDPHATPLDFADPELRRALDEHATFNLGRGLDAISLGCVSRERFRVITRPGLIDPGLAHSSDTVSVDAKINGDYAIVTTRKFVAGTQRGDYRWQVSSTRQIDLQEIRSLRDAARRLLLSGMTPAIGDAYVDSSEWIVETCRNERYHFWRRRNPNGEQADQAAFVAFAQTLAMSGKPAVR